MLSSRLVRRHSTSTSCRQCRPAFRHHQNISPGSGDYRSLGSFFRRNTTMATPGLLPLLNIVRNLARGSHNVLLHSGNGDQVHAYNLHHTHHWHEQTQPMSRRLSSCYHRPPRIHNPNYAWSKNSKLALDGINITTLCTLTIRNRFSSLHLTRQISHLGGKRNICTSSSHNSAVLAPATTILAQNCSKCNKLTCKCHKLKVNRKVTGENTLTTRASPGIISIRNMAYSNQLPCVKPDNRESLLTGVDSTKELNIRHLGQCDTASSITKKPNNKVTLIGAAGRMGQLIALQLKQSPLIGTLALADLCEVNDDLGLELSHIDTSCDIEIYTGAETLTGALKQATIVLICAGQPRSTTIPIPENLFCYNAELICEMAAMIASTCPTALVAILTQPIDVLFPMFCQVLMNKNAFDPQRLFGVTAVDVVRASTLVARDLETDPTEFVVPVIGGHGQSTMVPVLSQTKPCMKIENAKAAKLTSMIRSANTTVFEQNDCERSAIIAPSVAAVRFTNALLRGLNGCPAVVQCALVRTSTIPGVSYFSMPIELGKTGIKRHFGLPKLSEQEKKLLKVAVDEMKISIHKGEDYVASKCDKPIKQCF